MKLPDVGPILPPLPHQLSVRVEVIEPRVVRLDHNDVSSAVTLHALRPPKLRLVHLPRHHEGPILGKLLHAPRHVHDIQIVFVIKSDGSGFVELSRSRAPLPDHNHVFKEPALKLGRFAHIAAAATTRQPGNRDHAQERNEAAAPRTPKQN